LAVNSFIAVLAPFLFALLSLVLGAWSVAVHSMIGLLVLAAIVGLVAFAVAEVHGRHQHPAFDDRLSQSRIDEAIAREIRRCLAKCGRLE